MGKNIKHEAMTKREAEIALKDINKLYNALSKANKKRLKDNYLSLKAKIIPYKNYKPSGNSNIAKIARRLLSEFIKPPYQLEELVNNSRKKEYVETRFLAWYYLHYYFLFSFSEIGRLFNKNHATIMYGIDRMVDYYKYDMLFKKRINDINENLKNNWDKNNF